MRLSAGRLTAIVAIALAWPSASHADEPSPKRPIPDYDGLGREEAKPGLGWWALRVPLAPLYVTSEFVLRRPLGFLTVAAERAEIPRKLYDFFLFGPDHKAGIFPVAFVEAAFQPTVGAYAFWDDAFFRKSNQLRIHLEGWPSDWLIGSITERELIDSHTVLQLRAKGVRRPDKVFYGIGPSAAFANQSRYDIASFDSEAMVSTTFWRRTGVELALGARKIDVGHSDYGSKTEKMAQGLNRSVEESAAAGAFPLPYGFNQSHVNPHARALARFDTRRPGEHTGSGVRVEAEIDSGGDAARGSGFVHWGGSATGFWDLTGTGRVLSLTVATAFVDPLGKNPIPFTELVTLGGDKWMTGFYDGRLVDRSSAILALEYAWPIAAGLNATLKPAIGNVFGEHLQGFDPKLLRFSAAFGLATITDVPLELLIGFATDTFENGARVAAVRFTLGVPHRL
jgi:hypothetical protein